MNNAIVFELFANYCGMGRGAKEAGFEVPYMTDINPNAKVVFDHNYESEWRAIGRKRAFFHVEDVKNIDFQVMRAVLKAEIKYRLEKKQIACLIGGPPCDFFCKLNCYRRPFAPSNMLMFEFLRLIAELEPATAWIEQVPSIFEQDMMPFWLSFSAAADALDNYVWSYHVLNAAQFGSRQSRERATIIFVHKDLKVNLNFPKPHKIDLATQSAYACIGAKEFSAGHFKAPFKSGYDRPFCTLTGGDNARIKREGSKNIEKLSLFDRKILTHTEELETSMLPSSMQKEMYGQMVLKPFAYAMMSNIMQMLRRSRQFAKWTNKVGQY